MGVLADAIQIVQVADGLDVLVLLVVCGEAPGV
jgi:hypothetical protein